MIEQGRTVFDFEDVASFSPTNAQLDLMHACILMKQEKDFEQIPELWKRARFSYQNNENMQEELAESFYLQAVFLIQLRHNEKKSSIRPSLMHQKQIHTSSEDSELEFPLEKMSSPPSDLIKSTKFKKMKKPQECLDIALKYFRSE